MRGSQKIENSEMMNDQKEVDLYRDTYVRYLGNDKKIVECCYRNFLSSFPWWCFTILHNA